MADQGKIPTELEKIESGAIANDAVNRCMLHLVREDEYPNMYILSGSSTRMVPPILRLTSLGGKIFFSAGGTRCTL